MPLEACTAFRFGFLLRCAEAGLDPAAAEELVKHAEEIAGTNPLSYLKYLPLATAGNWLGETAKFVPAAGLVGAAAVGAGGGLLANELRQREIDPEEIKKQELIAAYNTFGEQLRQNRKLNRPAQRPRLRVPL